MARKRTRTIVDIAITEGDLKKLKKGHRIFRNVDKKGYCVYLNGKDARVIKQIKALKAQIRELTKHKGGDRCQSRVSSVATQART